jgi:hypothetical protein
MYKKKISNAAKKNDILTFYMGDCKGIANIVSQPLPINKKKNLCKFTWRLEQFSIEMTISYFQQNTIYANSSLIIFCNKIE